MTLTPEQLAAVLKGEVVPLTVGGQECVLVRRDAFERHNLSDSFDTDPWTKEEMDLLADEAEAIISANENIQGSP